MRPLLLALGLTLAVFWLPAGALAAELERPEGGIGRGQDYQEVNFLSGRPVLLTGKLTSNTSQAKDGVAQTRLNLTLGNKEAGITLTRSVSLSTRREEKPGGQVVEITSLDRFSETASVGKGRYTLKDYRLAGSTLTDRRAVVDYYSGGWNGSKTYEVGKGGRLKVESWGKRVGFHQAWGATETSEIQGTLSFKGQVTVGKVAYNQEWEGTFSLQISANDYRDLSYQENAPQVISFPGGFVETARTVDTLSYSYDLPALEGGLVAEGRNKGSALASSATLPTERRLPVPVFRDLKGHWAERDVERLYGLEALPVTGEYFAPALPMTRGQYAHALVKLAGLLPESPPAKSSGRGQPPPQVSIFADAAVSDPSYPYWKAAFEAGVMKGTGPGLFSPAEYLSRAQAVTALVRALGLEGLAPPGDLRTTFVDDAEIPDWAREGVYVAAQLGLLKGDEYNFVRPGEFLSRAEGGALLNRFLDYLGQGLRREYREKIFKYST